jgi:hypothetical protein
MESSAPVARLAPAGLDPRRWWALALPCGVAFLSYERVRDAWRRSDPEIRAARLRGLGPTLVERSNTAKHRPPAPTGIPARLACPER